MKAEIDKLIRDNAIPAEIGGRSVLCLNESSIGHLVKDLQKLIKKANEPEKDFVTENVINHVFTEMNKEWGTDYKPKTEASRGFIRGRLSDGHSFEEIVMVIKTLSKQWGNDIHMQKYLRPVTVFAPSKFEGYLNQAMRLKSNEDNMIYVVDSFGNKRRITKTQFEAAEDGFLKRLD